MQTRVIFSIIEQWVLQASTFRRSGAGGNPAAPVKGHWIPAYAGTTKRPSTYVNSTFLVKILLAALTLVTLKAHAVNYQDLWFNEAESGWGVNLAQQNETLFGTWFIYDSTGQPSWVVMSDGARVAGAAVPTYKGAIIKTTGAFFALPMFTFGGFTVVGEATFTFADARTGTLTYSINGASTTKNIVRQTFKTLPLSGTFYGGVQRSTTACTNVASNGSLLTRSIYRVVADAATGNYNLTELGENGINCFYSGTYKQYGSTFEASGNLTCTDGALATWRGREGVHTENTFSLKLSITVPNETCLITGILGGLRTN